MTEKETPPKEARPVRLRTLLEGLGILAGSLFGGLAILAVIGLIPGHQEIRVLQPVLMFVSLAMMLGTLWGVWVVVKAVLGLK
jgi:hypothetical protein